MYSMYGCIHVVNNYAPVYVQKVQYQCEKNTHALFSHRTDGCTVRPAMTPWFDVTNVNQRAADARYKIFIAFVTTTTTLYENKT